jgi:hypothetical protein
MDFREFRNKADKVFKTPYLDYNEIMIRLWDIIKDELKENKNNRVEAQMKTGLKLIAEEREKQIKKWGVGHDIEENGDGELIKAAMFALTLEEQYEQDWHFESKLHIENSKQRLSRVEKIKTKNCGCIYSCRIRPIDSD